MKRISIFKLVFGFPVSAVLLLAASLTHADPETGNFLVWADGSSGSPNYFLIQNKTLQPSGMGRCFYGVASAPLNSEGNKAMYSMLLAANLAGKSVTVDYTTGSSAPFGCLVNRVSIN